LSDSILDLVTHQIDIAIRNGPLPDSNMHARLLLKGIRTICATPQYWYQNGKPKHPKELLKHNCLSLYQPEKIQANWFFIEKGRKFSVKVSGTLSSNDCSTIKAWALQHQGIAYIVAWDIYDEIMKGLLEPALQPFLPTSSNLYAIRPKSTRNQITDLVIDYLAENLQRKFPL
jgi:DNA-binding transcriptional LysR family regulator